MIPVPCLRFKKALCVCRWFPKQSHVYNVKFTVHKHQNVDKIEKKDIVGCHVNKITKLSTTSGSFPSHFVEAHPLISNTYCNSYTHRQREKRLNNGEHFEYFISGGDAMVKCHFSIFIQYQIFSLLQILSQFSFYFIFR